MSTNLKFNTTILNSVRILILQFFYEIHLFHRIGISPVRHKNELYLRSRHVSTHQLLSLTKRICIICSPTLKLYLQIDLRRTHIRLNISTSRIKHQYRNLYICFRIRNALYLVDRSPKSKHQILPLLSFHRPRIVQSEYIVRRFHHQHVLRRHRISLHKLHPIPITYNSSRYIPSLHKQLSIPISLQILKTPRTFSFTLPIILKFLPRHLLTIVLNHTHQLHILTSQHRSLSIIQFDTSQSTHLMTILAFVLVRMNLLHSTYPLTTWTKLLAYLYRHQRSKHVLIICTHSQQLPNNTFKFLNQHSFHYFLLLQLFNEHINKIKKISNRHILLNHPPNQSLQTRTRFSDNFDLPIPRFNLQIKIHTTVNLLLLSHQQIQKISHYQTINRFQIGTVQHRPLLLSLLQQTKNISVHRVLIQILVLQLLHQQLQHLPKLLQQFRYPLLSLIFMHQTRYLKSSQ